MSRPGRPVALEGSSTAQDVEVRVGACPDAAATLRTVAADLAARAEFTLDAVADLRLAVDEACAGLVAVARAGSRLGATFCLDGERMTVTLTATTTGAPLPTETLGWRVLQSLADDLRVLAATPTAPGAAHRLGLRLSVSRSGAPVRHP